MSQPHPLAATTPREPMARRHAAMSLQPGARIGPYRVLAPLGEGGMSRVFLAEDEQLSRKVALKTLPPEDADEEGRARFLREAQALARVAHKNVVQVFASGVDEDVAWMALEYVEGEPLSALIGAGGVDEETAVALVAQAARGLSAVHAVGVVHRDVKPDNLLLDDGAVLRIADFGIALFLDGGSGGFVTQKGVAVGTPHFMSPEQARGGAVDARADAWGLGATLFSLLTGRPPFYVREDEPDLDILARVLREPAPDVRTLKPSVSAASASLVASLLAADAAKRPADLGAVADSLDAIADALAAGESPSAPSEGVADPVAAPSGPVTAEPATEAAAVATASAPPEPRSASSSPRASAAGPGRILMVAALFLALGAVVAFQVASLVVRPPRPEPPVVVKPPPEPPPPERPEPPVPLVDPPAPPAPPTSDELAGRVIANPSDADSLEELLARIDNDARAAVVMLASVPGAAGDVALRAIVDRRALHHIGAVERALTLAPRPRAKRIIDSLTEWRPFEAIALLERVSQEHKDALVRAQAQTAREMLFKVEGN
ncbi:MAG: serine/threonine protein kinase [Deltaproteobacteria bacterium]|nr:serine/threonine protein kinase [Deltaproteobacteria bacterium]